MRQVASIERNECLLKRSLEPMLCLRMSYLLKFHVSTISRHDDIKKAEIMIGEMLKLYRLVSKLFFIIVQTNCTNKILV